MITLKQIAEKCNVSIATVSNILNGKSNVSEDTKERILKVIKETGYKPNSMARRLRATKTMSIGILIDDLTEFSSPQIIDGIMSFLEEHGYKAVLEDLRFYSKWGSNWYQNNEYKTAVDAAIQEFLAIKVDGIIYVAGHDRNIDCIPQNLPIPFVISYAFTNQNNISSVEIDDIQSSYTMVNHLIKNGHKKIAIIAGAEDNIHTQRRLQGLKKALEEHNLKLDEAILFYGNWKKEAGYEYCRKLINEKKDFSAVFCFNDLMAAGVYDYINKSQAISFNDIAIVGFDNRTISQFLIPSLTTMEIPLYEIGRKSADILLKQIKTSTNEKQEYFIACNLIERESVKKI